VRLLANASLIGCEKLLLDSTGEALLNDIVNRAHIVNLCGDFEYEEHFIDNLRLQPIFI
jgi:uncharacterized 2Fe-2S/4Fe-4S cluster protein (DUF4445 family)